MPSLLKIWTPEEIAKMNEESFLLELLDTVKFTPELSDNDETVSLLKRKLDAIEEHIQHRLDTK